jgi:hypothetical protein
VELLLGVCLLGGIADQKVVLDNELAIGKLLANTLHTAVGRW